jgi:hypothetical protein
MSGHTSNLDTFGISTHDLDFNALAVVDGIPIFFDGQGAYVLDGLDDEGAPFEAWFDPGWTDGAGLVPDNVPTDFAKRVRGLYVNGEGSENLTVQFHTAEDSAEEDLEFINREGSLDAPAPVRAVPPQGLRSVFWRFRIGSFGRGLWRISTLRAVFDNLSRRV